MSTKLFVGNLDYSVTTDELREHFASTGPIIDCIVVMDRYTGRSRGFGFVEYEDENQANEAIAKLNETELKGRNIRVSIAKPSERSGGDNDGGPAPAAEAEEPNTEPEAKEESEDSQG